MPRALRAKGAARAKIAGLLAPHPRQGNALHPVLPEFLLWDLRSAVPVAVGRERPRLHVSARNGLSLLHGAAFGIRAARA
jgi:hypothetical protein